LCSLREYSLPLSVSQDEEHHLCAKSPHTREGGKTAVFVRESLMLETRVSRNLVNIVNSVYSLKEYCPSLSVFLDEQYHLCAESPLSSECEKH
jgi:hypothetical protein